MPDDPAIRRFNPPADACRIAIRGADGQNVPVDLARIAWLVAVLICLITVLILVLEGYFGYAGVTFAVAVAAAINLF